MALKAILAALDGLDDATKALYVEKDGKFVLDVEPADGFSLEDVSGLKTALGKERTRADKAEGLIGKFKDLDPDKARKALDEVEELKKLDPNKEADKIANTKFEAAKAQLLEKHNGEMQALKDRDSHLTKTIEGLLIDAAATSALAEAKGSVELLLPHVRAHTRVKEVDGKFAVEVVDKDGNAKIADSKGTPMDIKGLVAEMRQSEAFGRAFEGSGQTGTGKTQNTGGNGTGPAKGNFGGTREERTAAIAARFPDLGK